MEIILLLGHYCRYAIALADIHQLHHNRNLFFGQIDNKTQWIKKPNQNFRGLLHPGSSTKVAIKTVNDELQEAQFASLWVEMKILGHLDLHPNLVNLLGSCITEMTGTQSYMEPNSEDNLTIRYF